MMKKVVGLFLFVTNLFACGAAVPKESSLTPRDFARLDVVTKKQVLEMHKKWCDFYNERHALSKKLEIISEQNPDSAECATILSKSDELHAKEERYLLEEIDAVSRVPYEAEQDAVSKLVKQLPENSVDEVRIVDTQSFINGLYLNRARKDELISHLNDEDAGEWLCGLLCKNVKFADDTLKKTILNYVEKGCEISHVFRSLMIAYVARMEAYHSLCAAYSYYPKLSNRIFRDGFSHSTYGEIGLSFDDERLCVLSLLPLPYERNLCDKNFFFTMDGLYTFFHECGHSADFFSIALEDKEYDLDETMDLVAPVFLDVLIDSVRFEKLCESGRRLAESNPLIFQKIKSLLNKDFQSVDDWLKFVRKTSSTEHRIQSSFENNTEMWQMFGLLLLHRENRRVLYINKNSDVAFKVSIGRPFKKSHLGVNIQSLALISAELPVIYTFPEIYRPLVEAVTDSTWGGYIIRLIYPNGLMSGLQREYDLYKKPRRVGVKRLTCDVQCERGLYEPLTKRARLITKE